MIPNGCDLDLFNPETNEKKEIPGVGDADFVALFAGAHGIANGLDAAIDAAAVLKKRGEEQIKLVFIGDGKEKSRLIKRADEEQLDNCLFLDPVSKTALPGYLKRADIGLMLLQNIPAFYYGTSPNKFFDYISAGIPVLNNYPGWVADLINQHECGIVVSPDSPEVFADGLLALKYRSDRDRLGKNARNLAENQFNRKVLSDQFVDFLEYVHQDL